jgi:hypothetical protein
VATAGIQSARQSIQAHQVNRIHGISATIAPRDSAQKR